MTPFDAAVKILHEAMGEAFKFPVLDAKTGRKVK